MREVIKEMLETGLRGQNIQGSGKYKQGKNPQNKGGSGPTRKQRKAARAAQNNPNLGRWMGEGGQMLGTALSKINFGAIPKMFGLGEYKMNRNTCWNSANQVPAMHSTNESVVIRHKEYIQDVNATAAFTQSRFAINPGLPGTFPFLAAIAQNFQEYELRGLVFFFKPTSSVAVASGGTNLAMGSIVLAVQYRTNAAAFVDKQQIENEMWSGSARPSEAIMLPVECDPRENAAKVYYVRGGPITDDPKAYDIGILTVASVGSPGTYVAGELWASYEVVLRKPQLSAGLDLYGESALFHGSVTSTDFSFGGQVSDFNSLGTTLSGSVITFPLGAQGYFRITIYAATAGACANNKTPTFNTLVNMSVVSVGGGSTVRSTRSDTVVTSETDYQMDAIFKIPDNTLQASINVNGTGIFTNALISWWLTVDQMAYLNL